MPAPEHESFELTATPPTSDNEVSAHAPGKLLIAGEFAVLEGAPALVLAINRHARATLSASVREDAKMPSPLHLAVCAAVNTGSNELCRLKIDTDRLFHKGRKLGLGSSAAACVAAVALLGRAADSKDQIFERALDAHRRLQSGLGSGFDVAASTYGGALIYSQAAQPTPAPLPKGFHWKAFAWNRPVSSRDAIERWRAVRKSEQLLEAASKLPRSIQSSASSLLDVIEEFQERMLELDRRHFLAIATPEQQALAARAKKMGEEMGAKILFKQSGAGGGDVGIALSTSIEVLQAFSDIAVQSGLKSLDLAIDMQGVLRD